MKTDVKIPPVGESITEVVVARWLKQDGEYVEAEEPLCEIESDKATFEIPAEQSGVLRILVQEGETVSVGSPIARIETNGRAAGRSAPATAASASPENPPPGEAPAASEAASRPEPEKTAPPAAKPYPVKIPEIGESITEVVLAKWLKQDGEAVQVDDLLCEIESDKATFELPAEQAGILRHKVAEGSTVPVGGVVAEILPTEAAAVSAPPSRREAPAEPSAPKPTDGREPPRVSPVAARILAEAGISPESVVGTGPGG
ncbi:MAG: dihydrolipoamide succinyltransferase, partial [Calditrichaeota bacterium]